MFRAPPAMRSGSRHQPIARGSGTSARRRQDGAGTGQRPKRSPAVVDMSAMTAPSPVRHRLPRTSFIRRTGPVSIQSSIWPTTAGFYRLTLMPGSMIFTSPTSPVERPARSLKPCVGRTAGASWSKWRGWARRRSRPGGCDGSTSSAMPSVPLMVCLPNAVLPCDV